MSLIYAEKFEFKNPAIIWRTSSVNKWTILSDGKSKWLFLLFDDKSKQRYKVKTNNMQGYDPYQIKKEELSGHISEFPPVQWRSQPIVLNYFLFSLSPLTKEGLKAYKSLESYNQFASGWVKEVKIKLFLNHLACWSYLGYWTGQYVMYFLLHSTVRYKFGALCLLLQLKSRRAKGASRHPAFMGNCPTINHKC